MTSTDHASLVLLTRTATAIAAVEGPVTPTTAIAALSSIAMVIETRGTPITPKTLDGITSLIEALRDEITS